MYGTKVKNSIYVPQVSWNKYTVYLKDFNGCDSDHSGSLNYEQVRTLLSTQLERDCTEDELVNFFQSVDRDHDGRVSLPEYISNIVGSPEWQLVGASLPPPPALYVPPELETGKEWTQKEINENRQCQKPEICALTEQIARLNQKEIAEAPYHLDEPSYNQQGECQTWYLNGLGLHTLPDEFGQIELTGDLHLFGNQLRTIPALPNVRGTIDLGINPLEQLPDSLGSLHVKDFNLLACRLKTLPPSIVKMKIDGNLVLKGNPLTTLPNGLSDMQITGQVMVDSGQFQCERFQKAFGDKLSVVEDGAECPGWIKVTGVWTENK